MPQGDLFGRAWISLQTLQHQGGLYNPPCYGTYFAGWTFSVVKMSPHPGNSASCGLGHLCEGGLETEISQLIETAALELFDVALFEVGSA
jgi:hypothetical protein